jgi:hypothetical protein
MPAAACEGRHVKIVEPWMFRFRRSDKLAASDGLISEQMPRALEFGHGILVAPQLQV